MPDFSPPAPAISAKSRRRFLLGSAAAIVAAGGGGAAAALLHSRPAQTPELAPQTPTLLLAAVAAEEDLIAAIDAAGNAAALAHLRADHVAHREALLGAVRLARRGSASPTPTSSSAPVPRLTLTQLGEAEAAAATAAAATASKLLGADAALLASISACEASHAELLR